MREAEGERERGVVFAGLDRVDALTRNLEAVGKFALAPVAFSADLSKDTRHTRVKVGFKTGDGLDESSGRLARIATNPNNATKPSIDLEHEEER